MTIKIEKRVRGCTAHRIKVGGHGAACRCMRRGFSLAEAMVAVVVLGIAAAGLLLPFTSGARLRSEGTHRTLGAKLASHLMEQISMKPFLDPDGSVYDYNPGPDGGETIFDNIDDYDGYTEPEGQVKDGTLEVYTDPAYARFSRHVSCRYSTVPQQPLQTEPEKCNYILVTVAVRWNGKDIATMNRLVSE